MNGPDTGSVVGRLQPRAIDGKGRWYAQAQPLAYPPGGGEPHAADSAAIVRIDRTTARQDTVAWHHLKSDAGRQVRRIQGGIFVSSSTSGPFPALDQWTVAPDGRIAFVHPDPYRVDFVSPAGKSTLGADIPYERVAVDDAVKEQYREEQKKPAMAMALGGSGPRVVRQITPRFQEPASWPDYLPPYAASTARFANDGTLWVQRNTKPGAPPTFDLIDEGGHVERQVTLAQRAMLVGFGTGTVYVVRLDDNDLQYLQRYRLPASGR